MLNVRVVWSPRGNPAQVALKLALGGKTDGVVTAPVLFRLALHRRRVRF
jgi:hypothetical protein